MSEDSFKTNLISVKELILDEQKFVTYVSLSRELCIHVNESKYLLLKAVEDIKKKHPSIELNVNYTISGLIEDSKARIVICTEKELPSLRKSFKMIFYQHIYSVNKGSPSVDRLAIISTIKFEDFPLCTGLIKSVSSIKYSSDEIGHLKSNSQDCVSSDAKPPPQQKARVENKNDTCNGTENKKNIIKSHDVKIEQNIKSEILSPKKDLASKTKQKVTNKTQRGVAGFFSKSNSITSKKITDKQNDQKAITKTDENSGEMPKVKIEKMDVEDVFNEDEKIKQKENIEIDSAIDQKPKINKTLNNIKKNAKVDKKRKRVLHVSDSESENERNDPFEEDNNKNIESEDEIPPTPSVNTVKITSGIINPKKRRKIVDKTYTDDDGYILTKKEEVYESCSETEDDTSSKENVQQIAQDKTEIAPKEKKDVPKSNKKKLSSPQKAKQVTLMNFFKKV